MRRPVRGIVSRKTTQTGEEGDARRRDQVREAIAEATADAMTSQTGRRRRRRRHVAAAETPDTAEPEAVNQPAPFLQFVIDHRLGTEVEGRVDAFSSHGAFVIVDDVRCYVPLGAMGEPRPNRARDVLTRGETRTFVDPGGGRASARASSLALPGFEKVAGAPSDETVEAELRRGRPKKVKATTARTGPVPTPTKGPPRGRGTPKPAAAAAAPGKKAPTKRTAAKKPVTQRAGPAEGRCEEGPHDRDHQAGGRDHHQEDGRDEGDLHESAGEDDDLQGDRGQQGGDQEGDHGAGSRDQDPHEDRPDEDHHEGDRGQGGRPAKQASKKAPTKATKTTKRGNR